MTYQRPFGSLFFIHAVLLFAPQAHGQTNSSSETPLDRLRREISSLEAKGCDPATPVAVREEFKRLLEPRRAQLSLLVEQQIAELKIAPLNASIALETILAGDCK
jgi:hypothetical protein